MAKEKDEDITPAVAPEPKRFKTEVTDAPAAEPAAPPPSQKTLDEQAAGRESAKPFAPAKEDKKD